MGQERSIIKDEFEDSDEIDTKESIKHNDKSRKRQKLKSKDGKVQIWVKETTLEYEKELIKLQIELLKLQKYVKKHGLKILIIFEGRDAAGKGGAIKRIMEHLNPRGARIVALEKPSDVEKTQWYFQRYTQYLPSAGEIVLFDRSWYNRAGVEPVMGFCSSVEQQEFLKEVPAFENMLVKSGIALFKFYFSVSKEEQKIRFEQRETDPLKQYKLSPVDKESQNLWDKYTAAKLSMLKASNTTVGPWTIIKSDNKRKARVECIKHVLKGIDYEDKISEKKLRQNRQIVNTGKKEIKIMEKEINLQRQDK